MQKNDISSCLSMGNCIYSKINLTKSGRREILWNHRKIVGTPTLKITSGGKNKNLP